jgi:hypothetical protein
MNDKERRRYDAFVWMLAFWLTAAADFGDLPIVAENFAVIQNSVDALREAAAIRTSGEGKSSTASKAVLHDAIDKKLRRIRRTARGIAVDVPGFDDLFVVRDGSNEQVMAATARDFVAKFNEHRDKFKRHGLKVEIVERLNEDVTAFESLLSAQAAAGGLSSGAKAMITVKVDEALQAFKRIDPVIRNVYEDNPGKLAAWLTASHVQRAPKRADDASPMA